MFTILLTITIYTVLVLVFVPLDKIAKSQNWVKDKVKQIKEKIDN